MIGLVNNLSTTVPIPKFHEINSGDRGNQHSSIQVVHMQKFNVTYFGDGGGHYHKR
jgi:hypothetical protein